MTCRSTSHARSPFYRGARLVPALLIAVGLLFVPLRPAATQQRGDEIRSLQENPQVDALLKQLITDGRQELVRQLVDRIEHSKSQINRFRKGVVIVGRVVLDEREADPRDVVAQMPIYEGGYFAGEAADMSRPVGFRLHGFTPIDLDLSLAVGDQKRETGDVIYVGEVHLSRLPEAETAALKGKLEVEDAFRLKDARLELRVVPESINTPSNGYAPRPRWPEPVEVSVIVSAMFTCCVISSSSKRSRLSRRSGLRRSPNSCSR